MNASCGSSGSFGSRVRSKYIVHKPYTGRRSNFCSKTIPIYEPVHKSDLNFSYSISHFSWLPQSVSKGEINCLSQKFSYASMMIDPVINMFIPDELKIYLHIYDNSTVTFDKGEFHIYEANPWTRTKISANIGTFVVPILMYVLIETNIKVVKRTSSDKKSVLWIGSI